MKMRLALLSSDVKRQRPDTATPVRDERHEGRFQRLDELARRDRANAARQPRSESRGDREPDPAVEVFAFERRLRATRRAAWISSLVGGLGAIAATLVLVLNVGATDSQASSGDERAVPPLAPAAEEPDEGAEERDQRWLRQELQWQLAATDARCDELIYTISALETAQRDWEALADAFRDEKRAAEQRLTELRRLEAERAHVYLLEARRARDKARATRQARKDDLRVNLEAFRL